MFTISAAADLAAPAWTAPSSQELRLPPAMPLLALLCWIGVSTATPSKAAVPQSLAVAAVQMRSTADLGENAARISRSIRDAAAKGARVVVFPECALTSYNESSVTNLSAQEISGAEEQVAGACRAANVYAIIGTAHRDGKNLFDSAIIIAPSGKIIERYDKVQLAERWPEPGDHLSLFRIDGVPCSIIICHDERYPELVRLPVLAGAQVIFYVSHESGLNEERKIGPYRAQIQARAVENSVFVVHANAPANRDRTGSHGHSRIVAPDGNLISEGSVFEEDVVVAVLDLRKATRDNARKSLSRGPLRDWWSNGVARVRRIE